MQAVVIALLESKDIITEKEADKLYEKLRHTVIPESLQDARKLIKTILKT